MKTAQHANRSTTHCPLAMWLVIFFCPLLIATPTLAGMQENSSRRQIESSETLTLEAVNAKSEEAEAAGLDEEVLADVKQLYQQAIDELEAANADEQQRIQLAQMADSAAAELESEGKKPRGRPEERPDIPADASVAEIESALRKRQAELESARQRQTELMAEPARRQARLVEIPKLIQDARGRLDNIEEQLQAPSIAGEPEAVSTARTTRLMAEQQHLQQQIDALNAEERAYTATADLIVTRGDRLTRDVKRLTEVTARLQQRLASEREEELEKLSDDTRQAVEETYAELKPYAQENAKLAERLEATSKDLAEANRSLQEIAGQQQQVETQLETTRERVSSGPLSDSMGVMLRQKKISQAELRERFKPDANAHNEMREVQAQRFFLEDQKQELLDTEERAQQLLAQHAPPTSKGEPVISGDRAETLLQPLTELLQARKQMLTRLIQLHDDLFVALYELNSRRSQLQEASKNFTSLIDETIFWIRSAPVIGSGKHEDYRDAITWLLAPDNWLAAGRSLTNGIASKLPTALPLLAGIVLLLTFRPRFLCGLEAASALAEKRSSRVFSPTITAFVQTVLLSLLWPAVLFAVGSLIKLDPTANEFARSLGPALIRAAIAIGPLEFIRQVCRHEGLAESHFDWEPGRTKSVRRQLGWLLPTIAVLVTVLLTLQNQSQDGWSISVGRLALVILQVMATIVLFRLFRPRGTWFASYAINDQRAWFLRFGYLRFLLLMAMQAALLAFALAGYYHTSVELTTVWSRTLSLAFVLYVLYSLALRFLLVRRRRLRFEQLIEQREQARKAAEKSTDKKTTESVAESMAIELKTETGLDITDVSRQARELTAILFCLLAVFLGWKIWQDILPASGFLDFKLWPTTTGDGGQNVEWVKLRDLMVSLLLFTLTFLGVRNIPGMLELLLLKQLPLDAGSRYAVSTIVRYIITVFGAIVALSYLKIPWDKYSWLVAAISVGLGFGLQEIVANFVSGLILLLERPVRVGDVVTIDGTTGLVSRIQMRATTVTNWDNQELVVPNKDLITGKLINWTLSSVINRIALSVGVEYGSDPMKVRDIIMRVAKENPDILTDPEPLVTFEEFGDSSLNFKLRCCITAISRRFVIIHELNTMIYARLTEAGIGIPFPQRDVNLKLPEGVKISRKEPDG